MSDSRALQEALALARDARRACAEYEKQLTAAKQENEKLKEIRAAYEEWAGKDADDQVADPAFILKLMDIFGDLKGCADPEPQPADGAKE